MIVRSRRLFHMSANRTIKALREPRIESPEKTQFNLCPNMVEATVSNCPSDTIALSFFLWCARQPNYFHDTRSVDRMVPVVFRITEQLGSVAGVVKELESIGCFKKAQTFLVLLRIYWRGNMYRLALEAFDEMVIQNYVPNTFARNIIIDILFKIGYTDAALKFLRDTRFPNFLTLNTVICNLCKLGDPSGARDVLREMLERGFCPNTGTFVMVLDCFRKTGRLMELLQLLGFMIVSGKCLTVPIWTIVIDGLCHGGEVDKASKLLEKMVDSGCSPSVVTYTCLIKGLFETQMHNNVFDVLDAMLSNGCKPDLILYNVMIDSLQKARRFDDAIDIFLGLQQRNMQPDSYTLSSLISILCSSGKLRLLPKLVAGLDVSVDLVACNSLLNAFCKAGFPSQAVQFYRDMVDRGFTPDSYSYTGLLTGLCRLGRPDSAVNLYHEILANNHKIDAHIHTVIIDGLIKEGQCYRAIKLFRKGVSENYCLDVVSYTVAIHGLFRGVRFEEARSLFDQMKQSGVVPNTCTYNVMLHGLCRAKDINAVKQLLREMDIAGFELDNVSFNTIISLLIRLRRVRSAFRVFKRMCIQGIKPNRATYSMLFNGLFHSCAEEVDALYPLLAYYLEDSTSVGNSWSDHHDELFLP